MHLKANSPAVAHHGKTLIGFNWIGGREVEGDLPSFDARSAVDSRDIVGIFPACGERDVEKAARAGAAAFRAWSRTPAAARAAVIGRIGDLLGKHQHKVAAVITREVGKVPADALAEVREAVDLCRLIQGEDWRLGDQAVPVPAPGLVSTVQRRPLGVVGILAGSYSPLAQPMRHLLPAILCGNTVVWKPSEFAPTTAYLLVRCMMDAGLAPGVVNVVNGKGHGGCGKHLVAGLDKGLFQKFCFTGSRAVGRMVGEVAGRNLVPAGLELGGKNTMVVMPGGRLEEAAATAVHGAFAAAGQRGAALGNIILHKDVAAEFKERFLAGVDGLAQGNPISHPEVDLGPMISVRLAKGFEEHWETGRSDGARLLRGGARWTEENRTGLVQGFISKGSYMQPCVWDEVTPEMKLFPAQVFGPTVNLCTVDSFDQAVEWANSIPEALSASLFAGDPDLTWRFARELEAGLITINREVSAAEANQAFGRTGWNGLREVDGFTRCHAVHEDALAVPAQAVPEFGGKPIRYEPSHWDRL
jgi:aldehyde dehydrogenase (NAD+)